MEAERADRDQRQCSQALNDEGEGERDVHAHRHGHPGREHDDEPADLGADVPAVRIAEQGLDDIGSREAKTLAAAPMNANATQAAETTWRAASPARARCAQGEPR